jgi:hypothetical protein
MSSTVQLAERGNKHRRLSSYNLERDPVSDPISTPERFDRQENLRLRITVEDGAPGPDWHAARDQRLGTSQAREPICRNS